MKTFKHSGDLGDIIYSLPTIRALGGGILYLDPTGGLEDPLVSWGNGRFQKTNLNLSSIEEIKPILLQQEYIEDVRIWRNEKVEFNLNLFRLQLINNNLADSHLHAFSLPYSHRDTKWLSLDSISLDREILLCRSLKVQSNHSFWESLDLDIISKSSFIGLPIEFEVFDKVFKHNIPRLVLSNLLEYCVAINGCSLFIGNQTFFTAIAEALKKNLIQEVYRVHPMAIFLREEAKYV